MKPTDNGIVPGNKVAAEDVDFRYTAVDMTSERAYGRGLDYDDNGHTVKLEGWRYFKEVRWQLRKLDSISEDMCYF